MGGWDYDPFKTSDFSLQAFCYCLTIWAVEKGHHKATGERLATDVLSYSAEKFVLNLFNRQESASGQKEDFLGRFSEGKWRWKYFPFSLSHRFAVSDYSVNGKSQEEDLYQICE